MPNNPYTLQQMPDVPDTSFTAYQNEVDKGASRFSNFFQHLFGTDSYQDWVSRKQNQYNNSVQLVEHNNQLYYDWLSSPGGQRSQLESAGYNPNFVSNGGVGSSAGVAGQGTMSPTGITPAVSEIGNPLSILGELLPMITGLAQVKNLNVKTEGEEIKNRWLDELNGGKVRNLNLGSDKQELEMSELLTRIYGDKGSNIMHFGTGDYLIGDEFRNSFNYQSEVQALELMKARTHLVNAQKSLTSLNADERRFLNDNYLDLLVKHMEGEISLQDIENDLRKAKVSNTGVNTFTQIISAVANILKIAL